MISQKLRDARAHGPSVIRARWYLRHADHLGKRVRVQGRPKVVNGGRLIIGDRVRLSSTIATLELFVGPGGVLEIEEGAFINVGTSIAATGSVIIGANTLIGPHCMLLDNAFHHLEPERRYEVPPPAPIVLEQNVWLGARVIVLPGVRIGRDSAVAAGSVVTADVPPRTLVGGLPAKVIRAL